MSGRRRLTRRVFALWTLTLAIIAGAAPDARAQGFISPLMGYDYGGDSRCPSFSAECESKRSNIGVAFGTLGTVGFESEIAFARNFFGEAAGVKSNVLTFMSNLLIAPKIGPVRPYVLGGMGLIKSRVESSVGDLLDLSNNNFGWDMGVGAMAFLGDHIGIRGEIRRFKSFGDTGLLSVIAPGDDEKLSFNRAAAGLVLAF